MRSADSKDAIKSVEAETAEGARCAERHAVGRNSPMEKVNSDATAERDAANELPHYASEQRTNVLRLVQDVVIAANEAESIEEAMRAALQRVCDYNGWCVGHVFLLAEGSSNQMAPSDIWVFGDEESVAADDRPLLKEIASESQFPAGEDIVGRVTESGKPQWVDDVEPSSKWRRRSPGWVCLRAAAAFPVFIDARVVAVLQFFASQRLGREREFVGIMHTIGIQLGHVIRRKRLEQEIATTMEREQRRIGSDIHDGLGQELTGLRYIAQTHAESLARQNSPDAETAQRIAQGFQSLQQSLRAIVRDLVPVEIDGGGLLPALEALAERTTQNGRVQCTFCCDENGTVNDARRAIHLYRIAQEAVSNAVRHARATSVEIHVFRDRQGLVLQIVDDGIGLGPTSSLSPGIGLRSMRHRAGLIGGILEIQDRNGGGTTVRCTIPDGTHEKTRTAG